MGRMDAETKAYMSDPFHFADAFNYLIYDGQPVIDPKALKPLDTAEIAIPYGNDARVPEQKYRDVLKLLNIMRDNEAIYVVMGVENQTKVNYAMPVKDMLYDALHYAQQVNEAKRTYGKKDHLTNEEFLSGFRKNDKLLPVITLVIYFGASEWDGPMCIHDMLNTKNERLLRFVPDYRINLIAPAQVPDEDFEKFSTDFRDVLQFIKYSRDEQKIDRLTEGNERFSRMNPETAELINLVTDSKLKLTVEEGTVNMCEAIRQKVERSLAAGIEEGMTKGIAEGMIKGIAEGMTKGIAEGMTKGIAEGRLKAYAEMVADGTIDVHIAAKKLNMSVDEFVKETGVTILKN